MSTTNYEAKRTQTLVLIGVATAVITTVTMVIQIPTVSGGYLNLGDYAIMMMASILPFSGGMFAAGVGSALADLFTGHAIYAIFTLFIKSGEVIIIYLFRNMLDSKKRWIPFGLAAIWMIAMYGLVNVFLGGGNWWLFVVAIKGDLFQGLVSATLAVITYPRFKELVNRIRGI